MSPLSMRSKTLEQESGFTYVPPYILSISPRSMVGSSHYLRTLSTASPTEDALVRKVNKMGHQLEVVKMKSERPYKEGFNTAPAFTSKIMEEHVPPRFKMRQTKLYDGSANPLDHLEAFKALMLLHGANDGTLCWAFPATLRKATRQWFFNLPPRSISSFE